MAGVRRAPPVGKGAEGWGDPTMNEDKLNQILRSARVPERPDEYWGGFPGSVIKRLQVERKVPVRSGPWRLAAALVAAVACGLFLGFVLWHRFSPQEDRFVALRDGRVLREMQAEYPGRLQAIIQDGSGVHTQLSEAANISMSNPVLLEIRDGRDHRVIVTFSGQVVQCGGRSVMVHPPYENLRRPLDAFPRRRLFEPG
jgi:rRNA maturation protein Nop10